MTADWRSDTDEKPVYTPIRLLLVDDHRLVRTGLQYAFEAQQINIVGQAGDGQSAIEAYKQYHPDLVLMDLSLPGMDGIEATQKIREMDPAARIIILTSSVSVEQACAALSAGAYAYCLKDLPVEKIIDVIRDVLEGAVWLDPKVATGVMQHLHQLPGIPTQKKSEILESFTEREKEVLRLLTEGKSNVEIAEALFVSVHTVKAQIGTILQKLAVNDRLQAAVKAIKENLV